MTSKNYIINNLAILEELKEKALAEGDREYAERVQTDIDEFDNVFNDLKRLDDLKKENQELSQIMQLNNEYIAGFERVKTDLINENQKLKKAIKILKIKLSLHLKDCIHYKTVNGILPIANNDKNVLTKQEYKLLKEVLEND